MLLLIAVANVASWVPDPPLVGAGALDRGWVFARTTLIDGRSYPLFAMLFGFGLATIALRYDDAREAGRVLRRRGWWLAGFGLVHAIVFPGDVLGAYGLAAVLLSSLIAHRRRTALAALGIGLAVVATTTYYAASASFETGDPGQAGSLDIITMPVPDRLGLWLASSIGSVLLTAVVPCIVIGVFIAHSGILTTPWRHRRLLGLTAVGGLGLAVLLGIPAALALLDDTLRVGVDALHGLGSYPGGVGWLALIAFVVAGRAHATPGSGPPEGSAAPNTPEAGWKPHAATPASGPAALLSAIGKRSLTAYLCQTLVFAPVFYALHAAGLHDGLTPLAGAGIAVIVWVLAGLFCVALERAGRRGPFEALNRRLVYGWRPSVTASSDATA